MWLLVILTVLLSLLGTVAALSLADGKSGDTSFNLSDRLADVEVVDGDVILADRHYTPEAFVAEIDRLSGTRNERGYVYKILDVTGPLGVLWVVVGLLGQVLFTGRMVVQWLASEKEKKSVVPPAFWWMSFSGAAMLLSYFIWRTDIVGVLGQTTGFFIYARNLWLIYRPTTST